jgi:dihydrofolate reductase
VFGVIVLIAVLVVVRRNIDGTCACAAASRERRIGGRHACTRKFLAELSYRRPAVRGEADGNPAGSGQESIMRQIIVTEFISLDGVVDSPGGDDGFRHAGWTFKDIEPDMAAYEIKGREQEEATALLLGRVSYDIFAPVWPQMQEFAGYNAMPKYVVSTGDPDTSLWHDTTVLRSLDEVAELKAGDGGPIIVNGSAKLAQSLAAGGLVDRYHLLVFPVVLGAGNRLWANEDQDKTRLTLAEHATYSNGVQLQVWDVVR